ncbi:hypothetical protein AVEN_25172-1 [Araneus ventricosus]|uniref:Uncharacterized protein n=1 Tax=Araneus ventricosus TaxID=182803 RepID=A0A4Y2CZ62_ARAVE|nr:hypothetical protein AVEN_25172-1 [Araneus ventricosus]
MIDCHPKRICLQLFDYLASPPSASFSSQCLETLPFPGYLSSLQKFSNRGAIFSAIFASRCLAQLRVSVLVYSKKNIEQYATSGFRLNCFSQVREAEDIDFVLQLAEKFPLSVRGFVFQSCFAF